MLSLVAGDAIDVFLLGQLRLLRQERTLARIIGSIQAALWPAGTWFMYRPEYKSSVQSIPSPTHHHNSLHSHQFPALWNLTRTRDTKCTVGI